MAIEDAASLAKLLSAISCKEDVPKAIRAFEDTRVCRDGEEQRIRDGLQVGNEELSPIWSNVEDQLWLYGHDI
ncbi:hypothetical protein BDR22DRAFT_893108 [Usnea florida]